MVHDTNGLQVVQIVHSTNSLVIYGTD